MKLSILIPNYNGEKILPIFLPSVLEAKKNYPHSCELIIVDDCSTDNSIEVLKEICGNLAIIKKNDKNLGFSGTCNKAASLAAGEVLFFLNTDVELSQDFFSYFEDYFSNEDTFAVTINGSQYKTGELLDGVKVAKWKRGNLRVTENIFPEKFKMWQTSFSVQGAYFFVCKKKFELLEGFDERFNPYIFEETDLCYRALKRGWKIYYDFRAKARHDHSTTLNSVASKKKIDFYSTRNRMLFTWKNISDFRYLFSHFLFILLRLPKLYSPLFAALKLWPSIKASRSYESNFWLKKDSDIIK
jgi:GT2 family glycosyltransferase